MAVKISDRDVHEQTSQHINSLKHDALLKQLSDLYIDNDSYENDASNVVNTRSANKDLHSNLVDDTIFNDNGHKQITIHEMNSTTADKNKNITNLLNIVNNDDKSNMAEKIDNTTHITEPKPEKVQYMRTIKVVDNEGLTMHHIMHRESILIDIVAVSGAKAIVPLDNYNGFSTSNGIINCKLCQKLITDKNEHSYDEEHTKKVQTLIEDEHFIRQVCLCTRILYIRQFVCCFLYVVYIEPVVY